MNAHPSDDALALVHHYATDARHSTVERDLAIQMARIRGRTLRQIADAAGLTPAGIGKIVARMPVRVLDNSVDKDTIEA